jgi:signal transduction histidine kinase
VSDKEVEPNFSSPGGGILSGRFMSSKSVCLGSVLAVLLPIGMAQAETPQRHKRWGIAEADVPSERVIGDRIQIQQVLINLVLNAMDAVADGGTVWAEKRPGGGATFHVDLQASKMPRREAA